MQRFQGCAYAYVCACVPGENQALVRLIQMPKNNFKLAAIYEEGLFRWENIPLRNMLDHPLAWD